MQPKYFTGLAAVAGVSLALALIAYNFETGWTSGAVSGARLFPDLQNTANDAKTVHLTQHDQVITLVRNGETWNLKDRDGFAASAEKARTLLIKLAGAQLIEAKTKNPDRYSVLELENPTAKEAKSRLVRIADSNGRTLAEVVIGKKRVDAFGTGKSGTYVRRPGDAQTWLVNADLEAPVEVAAWAASRIVYDSERDRIERVTINMPGEDPLKLERDINAKDQGGWKIADMPQDKKIRSDTPLDGIVNGYTRIELEDVRKGASPPTGTDLWTAVLEEKEGLKVTFRVRREKDASWMSISAAGDGKSKEAADKINKDAGGWEYKISKTKSDQIFKRRSEIYEKTS